jgi:hypothetical protein
MAGGHKEDQERSRRNGEIESRWIDFLFASLARLFHVPLQERAKRLAAMAMLALLFQ